MGKKKAVARAMKRGEEKEKNGDKPSKISCMICGKGFNFEHKMKVHLRIHTGETPYSCPHCEKSFAQNAALKVHIRTHTGERPFACETCDKRFSRADHLNQHIRTHTGETPYKCTHCSKSFATWSAISRHRLEHISRSNFECSWCKKKFSRSDNLRSHVMKCHSTEAASVKVEEPEPPKEDVADLIATLVDGEQFEFGPHFLANEEEDENNDTKAPSKNETE